jgi:ATP-dependent DNA helicase RecG
MSGGSLFPEEIDRYDPQTIREAINNCIAHQDYLLGGKINVVESEDGNLIFTNLGSFIPESIENVINLDAPPEYYRNKFLANAMVSVNMIDTIGSGIRKMFISQRKKLFPLPEYDLSGSKVKLTIIGKVLDIKYARKLAQIPDLDLKTIIILDKVQKRKKITEQENKMLRKKGLIEGKSPNLYISSKIALTTNEKGSYMKLKGIEDEYAQKMILDYLEKFKKAYRSDFEDMLLDKLPGVLDIRQRKDKVKNLLQKLKKSNKIEINNDNEWGLSK